MEAFNGDIHILKEFKRLIQEFEIDLIIETGTYKGQTTEVLSEICKEVVTIEINGGYQAEAIRRNKMRKNIIFLSGSSPQVLNTILPKYKDRKILMFLDAHWNKYNPLPDELKMIAKHEIKPVIAIHDFKVPGKDFGYDSYGGQAYVWGWIAEEVKMIYGKDFKQYYNSEATGARRGVCYIHGN